MDHGVAGAAAVIAVLSRSYLSSRFGRWEWQAAILANPDDQSAKLITIWVEDIPLEGLLSTINMDLVGVRGSRHARDLLRTRVSPRQSRHHPQGVRGVLRQLRGRRHRADPAVPAQVAALQPRLRRAVPRLDGVAFDAAQPWTFVAVPDLRVVIAGLNSSP